MQIVVVTGSGRRNGTSSFLADAFISGAEAAGHEVFRFDAAMEELGACRGCGFCRKIGTCIQKDAFEKLTPKILAADVIAWATPVYYMTMTAQLKTVIDRMYQLELTPGLKGGKRYVLLATAWDPRPEVFHVLTDTFRAFHRFLKWDSAGAVLASGMDTRQDIEKSDYGEQAYLLGREL